MGRSSNEGKPDMNATRRDSRGARLPAAAACAHCTIGAEAARMACLKVMAWSSLLGLLAAPLAAGDWIAPDWDGREPGYPPGSLFWHTDRYRTSPVLFRTTFDVPPGRLRFAGARVRIAGYATVFLNGSKVVAVEGQDEAETFPLELTHRVRPGPNALVVSTGAGGLALTGAFELEDGTTGRFSSGREGWRVQKFPPLTILEDEPGLQPGFDDSGWFRVVASTGESIEASVAEIRRDSERLRAERLSGRDEDARWRLSLLVSRGIAVVDREARGWAGPGRLPEWLLRIAEESLEEQPADGAAGRLHERAEALTRYVVLSEEAAHLGRLGRGLRALGAPGAEADALKKAALVAARAVESMGEALKEGHFSAALAYGARVEAASVEVRRGRILTRPHEGLDNKFGWCDTTRLLESDPSQWGIRLAPAGKVFSSPLSPASLVEVETTRVVLEGWATVPPGRVYRKPPVMGPVGAWVAREGEVVSLRPGNDGVVFDAASGDQLTENWLVLIHDLARGGGLPIQIVFLDAPSKVLFLGDGEGADRVAIEFPGPGGRFFLLQPLKEWRGFLGQARDLTAVPLKRSEAGRYLESFRFWSRALLAYPVTFSEAAVEDPDAPGFLRVADVYEYRRLTDAWGTEPLMVASLPVLASYGLLRRYPGLEVLSDARVLGSWGVWGDHVGLTGKDHIVYRIPIDPIPRYGGFTSYCFGPTDIGGPGSLTEVRSIRSTGSNSFRPQHNSTGERALRTARWCRDEGIQNVFNIDEKWVPDAVEHFKALARMCREFPPWAVAYDILNEPETRDPRAYNAFVRKITAGIREIDATHLIYIETMPPWGPGAKPFPRGAFESLEPTGDPLTVYSFHDYEYRLPPRWPHADGDARDLLARWIPAFRFAIDHRAAIHLGEFGGFEQTKQNVFTNPCAMTMMLDYLAIFDQFGWHWHYYANRGVTRVRKDGSLEESYVQAAYRRYFARGTFNAYRQDR